MADAWHGYRDDVSEVGSDGLLVANGLSFRTHGQVTRRPGLGDRVAQSGVLVAEFQQPINGTFAVFFTSSGTLESIAL